MAKTNKRSATSRQSRPGKKTRTQASPKSAGPKPKKTDVSQGSPRAVRLTFSYEGPAVKLVSQERVEMIVPPSDPLQGIGKQKGFWAVLRDKQDRALYRQVIHNPTRNDAEIFPDLEEDPDAGISRAPAPKRKGIFVVLVPDIEEGDSVTMCRSPLDKTGPGRGVRSLASRPASQFRRIKLSK